MKGRDGQLDLEKAAMLLLTDYRSGALGRISLETPESRAAMLSGGMPSSVLGACDERAENQVRSEGYE